MKRFFTVALLSWVLLALLFKVGRAEAATQQTCGGWSVVPSLTLPSNDVFNAVAAVSSSDVWATGDYSPPSGNELVLIEHWNGSSWSNVSSPKTGNPYNELYGVVAVASNDVWTVGTQAPNIDQWRTLIKHWNGTAWSNVASPNSPMAQQNFLTAVAAVSTNNVWAVGYAPANPDPDSDVFTLIEHWDGSQWSIVPSPNGPAPSYLTGVTAISANDIWAVGYYTDIFTPPQPFTEHWDGTQWSIVSSPNVGTGSALNGVTAVSSTNVWAVGYRTVTNAQQTLIEHWNGTKWSVVKSPNGNSNENGLNSVTAVSASNIWAVGDSSIGSSSQTLIEHWNGTRWSVVSSPNPGSRNIAKAVTRVPGTGHLWMVGSTDGNTLTEFHC